ncbi:MAG: GNAT family N-acetyltransferase [Bacteroidota bacterium]|nr:GNAT family N-acetyltransferase [Bacteroidota bacterium]
MRKACLENKNIVVNILSKSFMNDPHINWLLEKSKNKNKLKIIMGYVFEESLARGTVYLNDDNTAVALWNTEMKEKVSFQYIYRNLSFLFRIGIKTTIRCLKTDKLIYDQYPKDAKYCQLYLIGVLPEFQGKGLASALMNPMIEDMRKNFTPMHLETANSKNINLYNKKGFKIIKILQLGKNTLHCMRR